MTPTAVTALIFLTFSNVRADPPEGSNWTPLPEFTDEFNADQVDQKKWQIGNPRWLGREPGLFADHNVKVKDGKLQLSMRAENLAKMPNGYKDYTCASFMSRYRVRYGYFEIRAKIMSSKGSSAFWFYHDTPELWTEIDVFEMCAGGSKEAGKFHTNVHVMRGPNITKEIAFPQSFALDFDPTKDFHVYSLEWDVQSIRWFIDGKLMRKQENTHWKQTLHLVMDTETMGGWFGLPDKSELPSTYEIDYVRAWQKR